jgi:hypothetical protein
MAAVAVDGTVPPYLRPAMTERASVGPAPPSIPIMPRFKVQIAGDNLDRAMVALNGAGIPTLGPFFGEWRTSEQPMTVGDHMWAVLDADIAQNAQTPVRNALPADGDYTVAPAEPLEATD